jgi:hypothetical protein
MTLSDTIKDIVWEVAQTMYTQVSKCKNDKIKGKRKKKELSKYGK